MTTVFIAGSRNIKNLDRQVTERIDNIMSSNFNVVIGDASGVDASIQNYLFEKGANNVVIYCSGPQPRNNIGNWPIHSVDSTFAPGTRSFFTSKDIQMAKDADYGLMIWDTKSVGTLSNIIQLLKQKKKTVIFINKSKEFRTISDIPHLESLLKCMSEHACVKADQKIGLSKTISDFKHEQFRML